MTTQQVMLGMGTPPTYATWNPADKAAGITLSGGNLIASGGAGPTSVRATVGKSTGKWYWEVTCSVAGFGYYGVADSTHSLTLFIGEDGTHGWSYNNSAVKVHTTASAYGATWGAGDVIGTILDMDAGTIEFFKNGSSQGVAFSGLSGTLYPAISVGAGAGSVGTANFGATAFAYPQSAGILTL